MLTDPEQRYRSVMLIHCERRSERDIHSTHKGHQHHARLFNVRGYLEAETPFCNLFREEPQHDLHYPSQCTDIPLYLWIANEPYLKRLIVGGFDGVGEFAKDSP